MVTEQPGPPLTNAEYLSRLRELDSRGWWRRRRNSASASVSVYRRSDAYFLLSSGPVSASGFNTFRRDLPAVVVSRDESDESLGRVIREVLSKAPNTEPEQPVKNRRYPVLRQMKARSWLDLVKTSATLDVIHSGRVLHIHTWVRDVSRMDGYQIPAKTGYFVLEEPPEHVLGSAVRQASDAVQP